MNNTPLNRGEIIVVHGHIFFARPAKCTMINNNMVGVFKTQGHRLLQNSHPYMQTNSKTYMANYQI